MPTERHAFRVNGAAPPVVELDPAADAIYVRFSRRAVARTVDQQAARMVVTVDLDARGEVVGIEAIGSTRFTLRGLLDAAGVRAPKVDLGEAEFVMAGGVPA